MDVVVTGGAGFIGSHLVDALLAQTGTSVLVVDNLRRGRISNLVHHDGNPRLRFLAGDVRDRAFLDEAFRGAEIVYHLAAQPNVMGDVSDVRYSFETNVLGTVNVLETGLHWGVRRVVFASSREVYGEPQCVPVSEDEPLLAKNTYGASKVAAEAYCRTYSNVFGLETAILRFASIYGPRDFDRVIPNWIDAALNTEPIEIFGGQQVMDLVWVGLAVEALLRASTAAIAGTPVNIASGIGTPIRELAERILNATSSKSVIRVTPAQGQEDRRFIGDPSRMKALLDLSPPEDPLEYLSHLLEPARSEIA